MSKSVAGLSRSCLFPSRCGLGGINLGLLLIVCPFSLRLLELFCRVGTAVAGLGLVTDGWASAALAGLGLVGVDLDCAALIGLGLVEGGLGSSASITGAGEVRSPPSRSCAPCLPSTSSLDAFDFLCLGAVSSPSSATEGMAAIARSVRLRGALVLWTSRSGVDSRVRCRFLGGEDSTWIRGNGDDCRASKVGVVARGVCSISSDRTIGEDI